MHDRPILPSIAVPVTFFNSHLGNGNRAVLQIRDKTLTAESNSLYCAAMNSSRLENISIINVASGSERVLLSAIQLRLVRNGDKNQT